MVYGICQAYTHAPYNALTIGYGPSAQICSELTSNSTLSTCESFEHSVSAMSEMKTVSNGTNYQTWKLQCRMALMEDGPWGIVNGSEAAPDLSTDADKHEKFQTRPCTGINLVVSGALATVFTPKIL